MSEVLGVLSTLQDWTGLDWHGLGIDGWHLRMTHHSSKSINQCI